MKKITLLSIFSITVIILCAQWQQTNGPYGGNVQCIVINGNNMYAGTNGSGIYKSTDYGENWSELNNGLISTNIRAIAIQGDSMLAGTVYGVYRSFDGGDNWSVVNSGMDNTNVHSVFIP